MKPHHLLRSPVTILFGLALTTSALSFAPISFADTPSSSSMGSTENINTLLSTPFKTKSKISGSSFSAGGCINFKGATFSFSNYKGKSWCATYTHIITQNSVDFSTTLWYSRLGTFDTKNPITWAADVYRFLPDDKNYAIYNTGQTVFNIREILNVYGTVTSYGKTATLTIGGSNNPNAAPDKYQAQITKSFKKEDPQLIGNVYANEGGQITWDSEGNDTDPIQIESYIDNTVFDRDQDNSAHKGTITLKFNDVLWTVHGLSTIDALEAKNHVVLDLVGNVTPQNWKTITSTASQPTPPQPQSLPLTRAASSADVAPAISHGMVIGKLSGTTDFYVALNAEHPEDSTVLYILDGDDGNQARITVANWNDLLRQFSSTHPALRFATTGKSVNITLSNLGGKNSVTVGSYTILLSTKPYAQDHASDATYNNGIAHGQLTAKLLTTLFEPQSATTVNWYLSLIQSQNEGNGGQQVGLLVPLYNSWVSFDSHDQRANEITRGVDGQWVRVQSNFVKAGSGDIKGQAHLVQVGINHPLPKAGHSLNTYVEAVQSYADATSMQQNMQVHMGGAGLNLVYEQPHFYSDSVLGFRVGNFLMHNTAMQTQGKANAVMFQATTEAGYKLHLLNLLSITPEVQLSWNQLLSSVYQTRLEKVNIKAINSLRSRLALVLGLERPSWKTWIRGDLHREWLGRERINLTSLLDGKTHQLTRGHKGFFYSTGFGIDLALGEHWNLSGDLFYLWGKDTEKARFHNFTADLSLRAQF